MRELSGELLELSFYCARQSDRETLFRLVTQLEQLGARLTGDVYVHRGEGMRDRPFAGISDEPLEPIWNKDIEVVQFFEDPNLRPIQFRIVGASGTAQDTVEVVTYASISAEAAKIDRHPVSIWAEGYLFCGAFRTSHATEMLSRGRMAYARFLALIDALRPSYASITIEESLECPMDLRRDPNTYAFQNFFISNAFLGEDGLVLARDMFSDFYAEPVADGLYISSSEEFNPQSKRVSAELASKNSVEVAKLIGVSTKK